MFFQMNLSKDRKKNYASILKIIQIWKTGGLKGVEIFLNNKATIIDDLSIGYKFKKLLKKGQYNSINAEIERLSNRFK